MADNPADRSKVGRAPFSDEKIRSLQRQVPANRTISEFENGRGGLDDLSLKKGLNLHFYHIPSGRELQFRALLTGFQDIFQSNWNDTYVYGRMDPIKVFQGTNRRVSISWVVLANDLFESVYNMEKMQLMASMLYPVYSGDGASTISAPPFFRLKFANLIHNGAADFEHTAAEVSEYGLPGTIGGFSFQPDLEAGFFNPSTINLTPGQRKTLANTSTGVASLGVRNANSDPEPAAGNSMLFPKQINLSIDYSVLHDRKLGWTHSGIAREDNWPYGHHGEDVTGPKSADHADMGGGEIGRVHEATLHAGFSEPLLATSQITQGTSTATEQDLLHAGANADSIFTPVATQISDGDIKL